MSPKKLEISDEITTAFPLNPKTIHLTYSQFDDARSLHIESSKPDPIAKKQLKGLVIQWENHPSPRKNTAPDTEDRSKSSPQPSEEVEGKQESCIISGTLSLSGEHVTVYVGVVCQWMKRQGTHETKSLIDGKHDGSCNAIENIFYFKLDTWAMLTTPRMRRENARSANRDDDDSNGDDKINRDENDDGIGRKERKAVSKARAGVAMRLKSDPYVRKLLQASPTVHETAESKNKKKRDSEDEKCPMFLCEVAIRLMTPAKRHGDEHKSGSKEGSKSLTSTTNSSFVDSPNVFSDKIEEKYDVSEDALEALRRSIFSQLECNISVLEFLLDMPWLQRHPKLNCPLAGRAALCLLEDAMFDACEKEGEDEMLDDLDISDKNTCRDSTPCSRKIDTSSTKRLKCSSSDKKAKK